MTSICTPAVPRKRYMWVLSGIAIWVGVISIGMYILLAYSFSPGNIAKAPSQWPNSSAIQLDTQYHNLIIVAHPKCSCTRATIAELSWIMTRLQGLVRARVLFVKPKGMDDKWEQTDLWRSAEIIDGVEVIGDQGGETASLFGALTSGQVYLFSPTGQLLFEGGITPTRSHQGDNVGRRRIISFVSDGHADRTKSSVFGCPINEEESDNDRVSGFGAQMVRATQ